MIDTKLFGQETLTAKPSALGRLNYKRLRIFAESHGLTLKSEFPHQYNDPNIGEAHSKMVIQINTLLADVYTKMSSDNV